MSTPVELNALQFPQDIELKPKQYDLEVKDVDNSFGNMLSDAINGVDSTMKASETNMQDYISGKTENVHDVMISMQRAQLSFQLMTEIRNKVIDTYNEISRMQI